MRKKFVVGITGASGSIYAKYFLKFLGSLSCDIFLVISPAGQQVIEYELGVEILPPESEHGKHSLIPFLDNDYKLVNSIQYVGYKDFFSPLASGSFILDGMVICPCSMGTIARVRQGISGNVLERTADVMIKEGRTLALLPREMPLSSLHLENMLALSKMGVKIIPAMPAFYHRPKKISDLVNFVVGKLADQLNLPNSLYSRWQSELEVL